MRTNDVPNSSAQAAPTRIQPTLPYWLAWISSSCGLADRAAGRGDHLGVGPDQAVLLGARVDPRGALLPGARITGLQRFDPQVGPVRRRDHDADPDGPVGVVRDRQREGALAAGQVDLDLPALPRSTALLTRCTLPSCCVHRAELDRGEPLGLVREPAPAGRRRPEQRLRHDLRQVLRGRPAGPRTWWSPVSSCLMLVELVGWSGRVRPRRGRRLDGRRPRRAVTTWSTPVGVDPRQRQARRPARRWRGRRCPSHAAARRPPRRVPLPVAAISAVSAANRCRTWSGFSSVSGSGPPAVSAESATHRADGCPAGPPAYGRRRPGGRRSGRALGGRPGRSC